MKLTLMYKYMLIRIAIQHHDCLVYEDLLNYLDCKQIEI